VIQREQFTAETHSYDEILAEKRRSESALQDARKDLAGAKRKAAIEGVYMDGDKFSAIERRIVKLSRKSQKLQDQLGISRRLRKNRPIESVFMDVCKESFNGNIFDALLATAQQRLKSTTHQEPAL